MDWIFHSHDACLEDAQVGGPPPGEMRIKNRDLDRIRNSCDVLNVSISYRANFVRDFNVFRGKDCLCIFAFMQIGHEIRNLAGRYVLRKTHIHNSSLQPCPNIQSRDILCGNILF